MKRYWTPEEDARLAELVLAGVSYALIASEFNREVWGCRYRASKLGLKMPVEYVKANREAGRKAFLSDPVRRRAWEKSQEASFTPDRRARIAERCRERNLRGEMGVPHHSWETMRKCKAGVERHHDTKRLSFAPRGHPLRQLYSELINVHRVGAAEARRIIDEEISRLPPLERQLLRVQTGAVVVDRKTAGEFKI